ncbi:MAG TPA: hypothetical protein VN541_11560 [Tepidisphaeraceae bacterium]|nr:hypothetical protein [Tepidisphaeraceae bacterium]
MLKEPKVAKATANRRISFDAGLLTAGLRYHLREQFGSERVSSRELCDALEHVSRSTLHAVIRRSTWEGLTDSQRLVWLMEVASAEFKTSPESTAIVQKVLGVE